MTGPPSLRILTGTGIYAPDVNGASYVPSARPPARPHADMRSTSLVPPARATPGGRSPCHIYGG